VKYIFCKSLSSGPEKKKKRKEKEIQGQVAHQFPFFISLFLFFSQLD